MGYPRAWWGMWHGEHCMRQGSRALKDGMPGGWERSKGYLERRCWVMGRGRLRGVLECQGIGVWVGGCWGARQGWHQDVSDGWG